MTRRSVGPGRRSIPVRSSIELADVAAAAGPGGQGLAPVAGASGDAEIDEVAVAEAVRGRRVSLTVAEQVEAVGHLTRQGRSLREIAALLHTSGRTVSRRRRSGVQDATVSDHRGAPATPGAGAGREATAPQGQGVACGQDTLRAWVRI